jgi:tetratricopeptide (TPR) repeat protein
MENQILTTLNDIKAILYIILIVVVAGVVANWIRAGISLKGVVKKELENIFKDEADKLYDAGDFQELINHCEENLKSKKNNVNALWYLGKAYYQLENYSKSKDFFEKVIKTEPSWEKEHVKPYLEKIESLENR